MLNDHNVADSAGDLSQSACLGHMPWTVVNLMDE